MMSEYAYDIMYRQEDVLPVVFETGELTGIYGRNQSYKACRVLENGRAGFYSGSLMTDSELVEKARQSIPFGQECPITLPSPGELLKVQAYSRATEQLNSKEMVEWGRYLIDGVLGRLKQRLSVDVNISRELASIRFTNSNGVDYQTRTSEVSVSMSIQDAQESDIHFEFSAREHVNSAAIKLEEMIEEVVSSFEQGRNTTRVNAGNTTLLIHPYALSQFLIPLAAGLDGQMLVDGTSPLQGKLCEQIFNSRVSISDDPTWAESASSLPFDGEGIVARKRPIVTDGVLMRFNHTLETAALTGQTPEGGSSRGRGGKPMAGMFNLVMEPGDATFEQMLSNINQGLYLRMMSGAGQSNNLAGEFSMGVFSGFTIENGMLGKRIKKLMITGNIYDAFQRVEAISRSRMSINMMGAHFLPFVTLHDIAVSV